MSRVIAFVAGVIFAVGLGISGMTQPTKVTGFLDFFGDWDPSLALVMLGAIGAHLVPSVLALRRGAPVFGDRFHLPAFQSIDARLLGGAALFGVGWGLSGYCPGPAVVATAAGTGQAAVFLVTMLVGFAIFDGLQAAQARSTQAQQT